MKNFLQMLYEFIPKKGIGFEKYLVVFCMLIGVQTSTFAQFTFLNVSSGTEYVTEGVIRVNPGDDITLTVPYVPDGASVKWEYRTKPKESRQLLSGETGASITVSNIQEDIEYIASYTGPFGGTSDARILIACVSLNASNTNVCPNEPVAFDLKGGQFAEKGRFEQKKDGPAWKLLKDFASDNYVDEWIISEKEKNFSVRVSLEYDYYGNNRKASLSTNQIDVTLRSDCKAECLTTTTGDYYVGTDFDPSQESGSYNKIPKDVEQHFGENGIIFDGTPGFRPVSEGGSYWLGTNTEDFFGQVPALDAGLPSGANHYLFCENPNDNIVSLKFKGSDVWGQDYQFKMRVYLQFSHECNRTAKEVWQDAKFIPRTGHGKVTHDHVRVTTYDNKNNLIHEAVVRDNQSSEGWVLFRDIMPLQDINKNDLIRVEIEYFGSFPNDHNYKEFTFEPRFEQFSCGKVAIDYISAEIENVCLDPQVLCAGEYTTAHAAGFQIDAVYRWYKFVGNEWIEDASNYNKQDALFQAEVGITKYQVRVTLSQYDGVKTKDFTISGNNCVVLEPKINGGTFCLPRVQTYTPSIVDHAKEVSYEWTMYKPDGSIWYDSKTKHDSTHFMAYSSIEYRDSLSDYFKPEKRDSLVISLSQDDTTDIKEGEYKLQLRTMLNSSVYATCDTIIHIYRNPDITLRLDGEKFAGITSESEKTICPSDMRREIIAIAENSFNSPMLSKYIYNWNSIPGSPNVFIPDPNDPSKATVNLAAIPGICDGDLDNVQFSVLAYIGGCADSDTNKYKIEKVIEPTIDCSALVGKQDTFPVEKKREDADITIPVPPFTSSCDTDPDLIIEINPKRQEVKDTMGTKTIVVRKSEIDNKTDKLNVTLPWGTYDFHYIVKDGCGNTKDCNVDIVIDIVPGPNCSKINDIDVIKDSLEEEKCTVIFGPDLLYAPVLEDENDINGKMLTGEYAGRLHFDSPQNKDDLKSTAEKRAKFDMSIGLNDEYEIDYTYILWRFTNEAGKSAYCVQEVLVEDKNNDFFDCGTIDPFEFRPITKPGECEIKFKDFWDSLKAKNYIGIDKCPVLTYIYGELHEDSINIKKIEDDRTFSVGVKDTVYWQFRDHHNNLKYCPQVINVSSGDSVKINCDTISERKGKAEEGTCFANAEDLDIPSPIGIEPCPDENGDSIEVPGVGTRNDGKALDDPYPTGHTYITWVFTGKNSYPSTCVTHVFVEGNKHFDLDCDRLFPDVDTIMPTCDSMDVTLETKEVADPCVAGYKAEGIPFINGEKIELTYKFPIGETFVTWKFWDYTKAVVDSCIQSIHLRDTFPPVVDCDTMKNDSVLLHDKCSIPSKDLRDSLGKKMALEYCTSDTIWGEPYMINDKGERVEFPSEVSVGIYPIQWVFANDSLTTKESVCDKTLYLLHDGEPIFDCNLLDTLQLWDTTGECKINTLPIPEAVDSCKRDYIVYGHGYVQLFEKGDYIELCYFDREKNKAVYLMDLPLGGHKIKWVFKSPFSVKEKICYQNVKANSDAINKIDCSKLAEYVHITMRRQGPGATFEEVRDSGLILPNLDFDVCKVLDTLYTRDDDKSIYADYYPVGHRVTITWLFRDTTLKAEKEKECHTIVDVEDGDTPIMVCPKLDATFTCLDALPARFANFEEFKAAGGMLISNGVDVSEFVDPSSFKCDTMSLGDKCDFTFIRKYSIANLRNQISECEQEIHVKDTVPPVWLDDATSLTKVFDCVAEDFFPTDLKAKDECSSEIISEYHKVSSLDGVVDGLFYTVSSNRSDNPDDCEYYNYTETRKYVAVDRCRNYSNVLEFVSQVQDTFIPIINMPDTASWRLDTIPAVYGAGCLFYYPDLTSSFPMDSVSDVCDPEAVKHFKISQTPVAGTLIQNTNIPHYVTIHITDPCGLEDTVKKEILVQNTKDIVSINMVDTTICAELGLSLMDLKETSGYIYSMDLFTGKWVYAKNVSFTYDFYKGEPILENLKYSNNKYTYGHLFENNRGASSSIILNSMDKEGLYTIVVMDTVRQCVDTANAYITIHGAPSIWLDADPLLVCEKDSIHLISDNETLYEKYHLIVHDNGEEITEEGWLLNGNKYKPETLLDYTDGLVRMQYYATNKCETGTSKDWISLSMRRRMSPDNLMLTTEPNNPARVYLGESAKLSLVTKYKPDVYMWYRAKGIVDGNSDKMFDKYGNVREDYMDSDFEQDSLLGITNYGAPGSKVWDLTELGDSAQYYVLLVDSVCPAVPSNIVSIDVVQKLPTAFTPHNSIGMNDVFMEGHKVIIFNRYGQKMVESDNGWDGTCRGNLVDPGVYFYEVIINDGEKHKGSIEVVYFK
ncbi:MAG: gliding motility-associated C-terminal domain-containing protein [Bacteroidales bacterium]|nr:gliding motility-associated C-terminal domain-containing protein [Bacteroidales bacterium]